MSEGFNLVSWNCAQSFRTKYKEINSYNPDILIIPECENPATHSTFPAYTDYRWTGNNDSKGLGVFTDSCLITHHREFECQGHFLYIETDIVDVFAVWTMENSDNRGESYIAQLFSVLESHPELLEGNTIVAGDFNWNKRWDSTTNRGLIGNFSAVQEILNDHGLQSAYHILLDSQFGEESDPTFFQHWDDSNPFHIDYIFAPRGWLNQEPEISVGTADNWLDYSDHMPLYIEF